MLEEITEISQMEEVSVAQVALAWVLHQPGITSPIVGVSKMYQLEEAVQATEIRLNKDYVKRINEAYTTKPSIGH